MRTYKKIVMSHIMAAIKTNPVGDDIYPQDKHKHYIKTNLQEETLNNLKNKEKSIFNLSDSSITTSLQSRQRILELKVEGKNYFDILDLVSFEFKLSKFSARMYYEEVLNNIKEISKEIIGKITGTYDYAKIIK